MKKKKTLPPKTIKRPWFGYFALGLLSLIFIFYPGQNFYQKNLNAEKVKATAIVTPTPMPTPAPINTTGVVAPELTAQGIIIMDLSSGQTLYSKNRKSRLSPASITKIMTSLVALEKFKLEDVLTVKTVVTDGRTMGLSVGEQLTFENLLYGILIHSANDAALTVAENYPGGLSKFVEKMNQKALELSMADTNFTNPIGFEENNHFTTPEDLRLLAVAALKNREISKIVGIPAITVSDINFEKFYRLENVNKLLGKIPGVLGMKTGWTEDAGECLVTAVKRNGHEVLIIILGSQDRFGETENLINWIFTNFFWETTGLSKTD